MASEFNDSDSDSDSNLPRKRGWPLVPEPFKQLSISRQSAFLGTRPMAASFCGFSINLNIPQYREQLNNIKQTELDERATRLYRRAIQNQGYDVSEFCWEVDSWHNVFGPIRDDWAFLIDKRPYEFIGRNSGQRAVERRVPDATMGLKSYNDTEVGKEFPCSKSGCNDDHTHQNPHKSLSAKRIKHQLYLRESGLIVDGVWGKTDLLFPFAVYEAKKKTTTYQQAKNQIYHACQTYLAMIDDLARDPTDLSKYQSKESEHHQMFAFISCGSYWEVYTAWYFLGSCFVETIWEADIKNFSRAYDLICIVDQIHDFAVTRHRPFVTRHLEAWLTRAENIETHQITEQPVLEEQPEWANIKQASKLARKAKAAQTRNHNFLLKSQMGTRKMFAQDSTPESIIQQVNAVQESDDNPGQVERGRRRRSKPDTNTRATRSSRVLRKRKLKA